MVPDRIIEEVCLFFSLSCNTCLIAGQELAHEAKLSKLLWPGRREVRYFLQGWAKQLLVTFEATKDDDET